jgi:hypothetical protein
LPFARKELAQADPESAIAENVESIVPINDVVSYALTDSFDRAIADTFRSGNQRLSDDPTLRTMLMQFTDEQNPSDGEDLASGMALKELGWA